MNVPTRLALFAALIAVAFTGAFAAGSAIDPGSGVERAPSAVPTREAPAEHDPSPGGHR